MQFCGMDEEDVSDKALMSKRKKTGPVEKRTVPETAGHSGRQVEIEEEGGKNNDANEL